MGKSMLTEQTATLWYLLPIVQCLVFPHLASDGYLQLKMPSHSFTNHISAPSNLEANPGSNPHLNVPPAIILGLQSRIHCQHLKGVSENVLLKLQHETAATGSLRAPSHQANRNRSRQPHHNLTIDPCPQN